MSPHEKRRGLVRMERFEASGCVLGQRVVPGVVGEARPRDELIAELLERLLAAVRLSRALLQLGDGAVDVGLLRPARQRHPTWLRQFALCGRRDGPRGSPARPATGNRQAEDGNQQRSTLHRISSTALAITEEIVKRIFRATLLCRKSAEGARP